MAAALLNSTTTVTQQVIVTYGGTVMLKGLSLGSAFIFLVEAVRLWFGRRNAITALNILQIFSFVLFQTVVLIYLIMPGELTVCVLRGYLGPIFFNITTVTIWGINWLKLRALYRSNVAVQYGTLALCVLGLAGQFQFIGVQKTADPLGHCQHHITDSLELIHLATDVVVRVVLAFLFGLEIRKHVIIAGANWDSSRKLWHIVTCDVRSTFIDTLGLTIKLILTLVGIDPLLMGIVGHVMDWVKMSTAHWFVMDVSHAKLMFQASSKSGNSKPANLPYSQTYSFPDLALAGGNTTGSTAIANNNSRSTQSIQLGPIYNTQYPSVAAPQAKPAHQQHQPSFSQPEQFGVSQMGYLGQSKVHYQQNGSQFPYK